MSNILDLLSGPQGQQLISGVSKQLGLDKSSASSALGSALPLILGALKNNSSSTDGAASLLNALGSSKHNGSLLDNLGSVLGGSGIDDDIISDGANILKHIFAGQENNAAHAIGKSQGIDLNSAMNLMKVAAPFVMSYLGKEKAKKGISDQNGITDLLGDLLGGHSASQQNLASTLQNFDNNDTSIDDLADLISGGNSSSGGIGSLLGNLFK